MRLYRALLFFLEPLCALAVAVCLISWLAAGLRQDRFDQQMAARACVDYFRAKRELDRAEPGISHRRDDVERRCASF